MIRYFTDILQGSYSLLVGMRITFANMFRRRVTVNYPRQSLKMTANYRGHIDLKRDEKTGLPKCVVCMACQKACPSACIALDGAKAEGATRKSLTSYNLDFTTCSLCGLCVDSCNFDALEFSKEYNLASVNKDDYRMDLLKRVRERK
ncbi:MAG: NADH-quinone oxidoreductase subunit I [Verrucomicrobia bacterium]|nr:NADH-quinone oxidoreductase subunit I [Verrucomicrobiota bacterium]